MHTNEMTGEPLRILRVVMISGLILLGVKIIDLASGKNALAEAPAAETAPQAPPAAVSPAAAPGSEKPPEDPAAAASATPAPAPGGAKPSSERAAGATDMSRAEIEVLQNLSARRQELEERSRELDMRDKLLKASEDRIGERIAELKSIEGNIQSLLQQRDQAQEAQIVGLVKVYEDMKPKDAARIFDKLDMEILLPVAQRMKAPKAAAVMAEMDPDAAKRLTVSLARHFNPDKLQGAPNAAPPPAAPPAKG